MPSPRSLSPLLLTALLPVSGWLILRPLITPLPLAALSASLGFSVLSFLSSLYLVPALGPAFIKVGLKGKDLLKKTKEDIPESMGLICASIYILFLILFIPFPFSSFFVKIQNTSEGLTQVDFPLAQLSAYLSAILSLLMATLLGFIDDLFDVRWRHKLPIPLIASIPLLLVYYAEHGNTHIVVPKPLRSLLGTVVDLGPLYYLYMSLLSTFSTNSINILAGLNALEVSQTLIIAISLCINDALYLPWPRSFTIHAPVQFFLAGDDKPWSWTIGGVYGAGLSHGSKELVERHLFSLYFMLPLIGVCLGFMYHNWYPARSFPGDTFCYFSGMAFAVVGVQGHFSKTLLLFFIPQVFNFLLSCPQLFGLVPCPRHRIPRPDPATSLLTPSTIDFPRPPSRLSTITLKLFSNLRLTQLTTHPTTGQILSATNLTVLNFLLVHVGPMSEQGLVMLMMSIQATCSLVAFIIRHGLAGFFYDGDRR